MHFFFLDYYCYRQLAYATRVANRTEDDDEEEEEDEEEEDEDEDEDEDEVDLLYYHFKLIRLTTTYRIVLRKSLNRSIENITKYTVIFINF